MAIDKIIHAKLIGLRDDPRFKEVIAQLRFP